MTNTEAEHLAGLIGQTWRNRPAATAYMWSEELLPLDAGTAGRTFVKLRREDEHAPSIARFLAVYRAQHTAGSERPAPVHHCDLCDGTGWVDAPPLLIEARPVRAEPWRYTQVQPCTCPNGIQAHRVQKACARTNEWPTAPATPVPEPLEF